ncbi:hypothetical protein GL325_10525 [Aeromicrobium sp. 636]|uniref:Uncharacterized protein n=1 Tax=Aeromicrobium senzhongii TaxID=2663859 RepID=A0A8I0K0U8_9ACTN|nr:MULTISPECIES: hypothetical protein [Aeromicrobium]MBC9226761.1 hypothetical protein [Aeromicrobium senzhongii]MCQ3998862.1 hypothetical protein [Aeromicrobium sp. 636]
MEIEWACAFCGETVDDDPRSVGIALTFGDRESTKQFYGAHYMCVKAALTEVAAAEMFDPAATT